MKNKLVSKIKELNTNKDYDCLLLFSGGKDSSYLLYFLSKILELKVATFTFSHKFLDDKTRKNIVSFTNKYSANHIMVENNYLNYSGTHFLEKWINKPDEESLITLCTGCRLGITKLVIQTAKKEGMNVVITGLTPFEATDYRVRLVNYPKNKDGKLFFLLGYLRLILRNPSLIMNWKVLKIQVEEYYYHINQKKIYAKENINLIRPFYDYLKYDEIEVINTLKKLNWKKSSISGNSFWRADCNMNAIRQYFHNKISGYDEQAYYYGQMLKDDLITKEYYDYNLETTDKTEDILKIINSSGISDKAKKKYEKYLNKKNESLN